MPDVAAPDVPVVLWSEQTFRSPAGYYVRAHLYLDERTGDPVLMLETSTSRHGPWAQMGRVL